jgi:ABC-type sugar transport system permease subunit
MLEPAAVAHNLMYDMYMTAFKLGQYGEASAKAVVLTALIVTFAIMKRQVEK